MKLDMLWRVSLVCRYYFLFLLLLELRMRSFQNTERGRWFDVRISLWGGQHGIDVHASKRASVQRSFGWCLSRQHSSVLEA